jgi:transcription termination/antitermination protein NusG
VVSPTPEFAPMSTPADQPEDPHKHEAEKSNDAATPQDEAPLEDGAAGQAPEDAAAAPPQENLHWYIVKVASGREESIKEAIERKVKIEGLQDCFGQIVVPVERRTELVKGKRVIKETKLMPGYLLCQVEFNERILYLFRETSGVGDFVGGGPNKPPLPMPAHEVERWVRAEPQQGTTAEPPKSKYSPGDRVKVRDGTFAGMEGVVKEILEQKGALVVELTIFGRPVPVELEYWQVDFA